MKFAVKIVLILFIAFLAAPTVVSLIEKSNDKSYVYSFSEEEKSHDQIDKDFKVDFIIDNTYTSFDFAVEKSSLILSENLSKHDNISASIFIPPPEQV